MTQPLLMDHYPRPPDGAAEIERERMSREHVRFAAAKLRTRLPKLSRALTRWSLGGVQSAGPSARRRAELGKNSAPYSRLPSGSASSQARGMSSTP
jgi:hypothetical protein